MSLNKYSQSSSSSSSSDSIRDKKVFAKLKLSGDYPRKNAELLSAQYGINVLLVGVALMLAIAQQKASVEEKDLLSFTTSLMILQLIWMMWYILVRRSQGKTRTERDVNATTCWIRGELGRGGNQMHKRPGRWSAGEKVVDIYILYIYIYRGTKTYTRFLKNWYALPWRSIHTRLTFFTFCLFQCISMWFYVTDRR